MNRNIYINWNWTSFDSNAMKVHPCGTIFFFFTSVDDPNLCGIFFFSSAIVNVCAWACVFYIQYTIVYTLCYYISFFMIFVLYLKYKRDHTIIIWCHNKNKSCHKIGARILLIVIVYCTWCMFECSLNNRQW